MTTASTGVLKRGGHSARLVSQRFLGVYANDTAIKGVVLADRPDNAMAFSETSGFWRFDKDADDAASDSVLVPTDAAGGRWLAASGASGAGDIKATVLLATASTLPANTRTGNVLLANATGALGNIDGVAAAVGNRVLVKDEATGANNGLYEVDSAGGVGVKWQMTRCSDADADDEVTAGMMVYVSKGTANGKEWFYLTTDDPITVNTTALTFVQVPSLVDLASTATGEGAALVGVEDSAGNFTGATVEACLAEIMSLLASTSTGEGAALVGVEDSAANFTGATVEACLAEIMSLLASTSTGEGAALVGVEDSAANFTGATVEACLAEIMSLLASTSTGEGAALVGVEDSAANFTGATVEACLAEIMSLLASTSTGEGAALVGVEDSAANFTGATVEACLAEIMSLLASTSTGEGAALVGVEDSAANFTGATVEACLAEIMSLLASTSTGEGAALVGVEDSAANFTGATVEACLAEIMSLLASTSTGEGAALVGVEDSAANFTGATVEACLAEIMTLLASTSTGEGAALVGVEDSAANFTGATVEACLAEIMSLLASTSTGEGAALVGVEDAAANFTGATVEACLAEIMTLLASTSSSEGASLVGIEDSASQITATTVEGALAEVFPLALHRYETQIQHTDLTQGGNGVAETEQVCVMPANAVILATQVNIATLFSGGGLASMTIDVGGTDTDAIADAHDVFTGAQTGKQDFTPAGILTSGKFGGETINCIFQPDGAHSCAGCTAGDLTITIWYIVLA